MKQALQSSDPTLRFQLRRDLEFSNDANGSGTRLVIKDPMKLEYFLFGSFEKILLSLLSRPCTLDELKTGADQLLAPGFVDLKEIQRFVQRLRNDNLVLADRTGDGKSVWSIRQREQRQRRIQQLSGILAIRFRGINPQSLLDSLNPLTRHLFHPLFLVVALVAFIVAMAMMSLNVSRIVESDNLWQHLQDPWSIVAIMLALAVVKIFHEFGHALACRSIGRDCHELGVMLLVLTPCLYCNVSDVWMEPDRWKRMLVSAAGIYVEMLIAALCVPLWLLSQPGPLQTFLFALLIICSVNTLLINGNPLLRYDGYYVLSDWLGIPNLYSVSQRSIANRVRNFFRRGASELPRSGFLDVYGLASRAYRIFILGVIIFAIYKLFERLELQRLGVIVSLLLFASSFAYSWFTGLQKICSFDFWRSLNLLRLLSVAVLAFILAVLLFSLPITTRVIADGETVLAQDEIIYAPQNGRLVWLIGMGETVRQGQIIAEVQNDQLRISLLDQQNLTQELELALSNQILLQRLRADNSPEIELQKDALASAKKIESQLLSILDQLTIRATDNGTLLPIPHSHQTVSDASDLSRIGSTLQAENEGSSVQRGEPVAIIVPANIKTIRLQVAEAQIDRIAVGQQVKVLIRQSSSNIVLGTVEQIGIDSGSSPEFTAMQSKATQNRHLVDVTVRLSNDDHGIFFKSRVDAVIIGERIPLYQYITRLITENFEL